MPGGSGEAEAEKRRLQVLLSWFLEPIGSTAWAATKSQIEDGLEEAHRLHSASEGDPQLVPLSDVSDRMAWYLYLLDVNLNDPYRSEPVQAARILPVFQRLADDFEAFRKIVGIEGKRTRLLGAERSNPDSGLFELLVALLWKRNGWRRVAFIPESPPEKRYDLEAQSDEDIWAIECKRLSKSSAYSEQERQKWLRMWRPLRKFLVDGRHAVVLDVIFHVELEELADDYLVEQVAGKLKLAVGPTKLIANSILDVSFARVDALGMRRHLRDNYVKYPSPQLNKLIAGYIDPNRGFTSVLEARLARLAGTRGNNRFVEDIAFAAGCYWHCDAPRSIERKARDIRGRLADAVEQIPDGRPGIVHIGLETLDGMVVEIERYRRIIESVGKFDLRGKNVRWVYCHLFQSYAPPDEAWVMDETVYYFGREEAGHPRPLAQVGSISPLADSDGPGVHWLKPSPYEK